MKFFEIDFNALKIEIHQTAKQKGWWDKERNAGEILMLVISELAEALEAKRKGKDADIETFEKNMAQTVDAEKYFPTYFLESIKDSVADELSDSVIRLLDYAGYKNIHIALEKWRNVPNMHYFPCVNFSESLLSITSTIVTIKDFSQEKYLEEYISNAILKIAMLAESENIDIHNHILLKMRYNKTRERMHGKKF
jgi:NTP pyrophosphatase (non-canonical NTP hydrolase)